MKTIRKFILSALLLFVFASGCELFEEIPACEGFGYLQVTNDSRNSVHKIIIDGTWYSTLGPNETETITLAEGRHSLMFQGVNGGGCSTSNITIVECKTEGRVCRN